MTTRRDFIIGAAAVTDLAVSGKSFGDVSRTFGTSSIPTWAKREIEMSVERFEEWKKTDKTMAFVLVSDVHSRQMDVSDPPDYGDAKMHIPFAGACAEAIDADFVADLGDQDYDWLTDDESLRRKMAATKSLYEPLAQNRPILFCMGNHDHGKRRGLEESSRPITNAIFGEAFNSISSANGHAVTLSPNKSWGCYDIPRCKLRVFFLNSSEIGYHGYSREQVEFVRENLTSLSDGWHAMILQHFCLYRPIGEWQSWKANSAWRGRTMIRLIEDFVWRRRGCSDDGIEWDFTHLKNVSFVGFFYGDSHFDNQIEVNFVHHTVFQGYGIVPFEERGYGSRHVEFDRSRQLLFDIVAVKPEKLEVRIFRVGAGGEAADRQYVYDRSGIDKCQRW